MHIATASGKLHKLRQTFLMESDVQWKQMHEKKSFKLLLSHRCDPKALMATVRVPLVRLKLVSFCHYYFEDQDKSKELKGPQMRSLYNCV